MAFLPTPCSSSQIPAEFDIDSENSEDCYMCPEYAKDIFDYLKEREVSLHLNGSLNNVLKISRDFSIIGCLLDWNYLTKLSPSDFIISRKSLCSVTTCTCSPASTQRWGQSWSTGWLKCRWVVLVTRLQNKNLGVQNRKGSLTRPESQLCCQHSLLCLCLGELWAVPWDPLPSCKDDGPLSVQGPNPQGDAAARRLHRHAHSLQVWGKLNYKSSQLYEQPFSSVPKSFMSILPLVRPLRSYLTPLIYCTVNAN